MIIADLDRLGKETGWVILVTETKGRLILLVASLKNGINTAASAGPSPGKRFCGGMMKTAGSAC